MNERHCLDSRLVIAFFSHRRVWEGPSQRFSATFNLAANPDPFSVLVGKRPFRRHEISARDARQTAGD